MKKFLFGVLVSFLAVSAADAGFRRRVAVNVNVGRVNFAPFRVRTVVAPVRTSALFVGRANFVTPSFYRVRFSAPFVAYRAPAVFYQAPLVAPVIVPQMSYAQTYTQQAFAAPYAAPVEAQPALPPLPVQPAPVAPVPAPAVGGCAGAAGFSYGFGATSRAFRFGY